jgi:hypothetical protein
LLHAPTVLAAPQLINVTYVAQRFRIAAEYKPVLG